MCRVPSSVKSCCSRTSPPCGVERAGAAPRARPACGAASSAMPSTPDRCFRAAHRRAWAAISPTRKSRTLPTTSSGAAPRTSFRISCRSASRRRSIAARSRRARCRCACLPPGRPTATSSCRVVSRALPPTTPCARSPCSPARPARTSGRWRAARSTRLACSGRRRHAWRFAAPATKRRAARWTTCFGWRAMRNARKDSSACYAPSCCAWPEIPARRRP